MKKFAILAITMLFILIFITGCNTGETDDQTSEKEETIEASDAEPDTQTDSFALCEIDKDMVGDIINSSGSIIFVDENNPEGKFAMLEDGGCQIGIFVPNDIWDKWDAGTQNLFCQGSCIEITGRLTSFDGELIIDLEKLEELEEDISSADSEVSEADEANIELPEAPESKMLDVPLVYSGSHNLPGLCYLGSAGMLVKYGHEELNFPDIAALSGIGSSALHLNFPEMPSMLISLYMDQSIVFMMNNLDAEFALGYQEGGWDSDSFQPAGLPFKENASSLFLFRSAEDALETLKSAVGAGNPVLVYINMYYVHDDFSKTSEYWSDFLGKDQASHYMVVTGYDEDTIYFNDPTDPTDAAGNLSAGIENFMQAWELTVDIYNAPPLGPFWMIIQTDPGDIPSVDEVIGRNLERAVDAPSEIRSFAGEPDDSDYTLFLLLELGNARINFGRYLIDNGFEEVGDLYVQSGELLTGLAVDRNVDPDILVQIADLEESAVDILLK